MSERRTPWAAGTPCWTDLAVPDVEAAIDFYTGVIGWSFTRFPEFGGYAIAQRRGLAAAAVGPAMSDAPPAWTLYLASDDADATAADITAHGGTVLLAPDQVGPLGRLALASDPTGAVFGLWQAGEHIGAQITAEPGGIAWEDLRSTDPDAARAFYSGVFGYQQTPLAEAGPDYGIFAPVGDPAPFGGMGPLMGDEPPSHWLLYFAVADADAAAAAVTAGGGTVLSAPVDTPFGRMAPVRDPFGAAFMLTQNTGQAAPDRGE